MLLVPTLLKDSGIHGLGVFATTPLPKGTPIWRYDPVLDLKLPAFAPFVPLSAEFLAHYGYRIEEEDAEWIILCGDHARFMNHDDAANTASSPEDPYTDVAVRDIDAGEEITCDYRLFDRNWRDKLGH